MDDAEAGCRGRQQRQSDRPVRPRPGSNGRVGHRGSRRAVYRRRGTCDEARPGRTLPERAIPAPR